MKNSLIIFLISTTTFLFGQRRSIESMDEIKRIIESYEPCNDIFCFEYEVEYQSENTLLIVKSHRYNKSKEGKKEMTELREVKIPMQRGTTAMFFPGEDNALSISTSENPIAQKVNDKEEIVSLIILGFNDSFVKERIGKSLLMHFNRVIESENN